MDAVKVLDGKLLGTGIQVVPLKTKCPQGSEKHLICLAPVGGSLPEAAHGVGAVVSNVGTAVAVADAVEECL